jgi:hypothetical protein
MSVKIGRYIVWYISSGSISRYEFIMLTHAAYNSGYGSGGSFGTGRL